jgi:TonB family protein
MFGNGGTTGSGNTTGNTPQGNPAGSGNSGGNSWSLSGRSLSGRLVAPSYDNDVEGKITVTIRVDANGKVISANIGSPTNISDATTRNAAQTAALNTKFTAGNGNTSGSITYNFKLR